MKIKIINGANLNLLGSREPDIYGKISFDDYLNNLIKKYNMMKIQYYQSNIEGKLINEIQKSITDGTNAIIINAGAYTHYSYAIRDALASINLPCVEVHISNIFKREEFRHKSVISAVCTGIISGFGLFSYDLAIEFLKEIFLTKI